MTTEETLFLKGYLEHPLSYGFVQLKRGIEKAAPVTMACKVDPVNMHANQV
jgi:hypothetical protein